MKKKATGKTKANTNKGKATTAKTAGIPKRAVMNSRSPKKDVAISGDTMSNYAMYKRGGKVKKYQTAGQAYLKYVPGAQAKDTLGYNDSRGAFHWNYGAPSVVAQEKMLDLTYGPNSRYSTEDVETAAYDRVPQDKKAVEAYTNELKKQFKSGVQYDNSGRPVTKKSGGKVTTKRRYKSGGSFPDLTGDGKVTKADVLKGRGVFKKRGSVKKKKK
jgi:hypothetical protein